MRNNVFSIRPAYVQLLISEGLAIKPTHDRQFTYSGPAIPMKSDEVVPYFNDPFNARGVAALIGLEYGWLSVRFERPVAYRQWCEIDPIADRCMAFTSGGGVYALLPAMAVPLIRGELPPTSEGYIITRGELILPEHFEDRKRCWIANLEAPTNWGGQECLNRHMRTTSIHLQIQ